ncbi:hypothetical protein K461DRAFT_289339 [Myriangium duriaei CBS 260.36]|uniref:Anaphase-promoting complex subunit 2 n=1 Tax=Myriangium duriaei CBS 260.36 TaxID=1168546 RepID=A0A9P4JAB0_9PEZI|nr:hypothetical protein K461DRAFT_289339 [Myriangium duriaei CBS 260.36]
MPVKVRGAPSDGPFRHLERQRERQRAFRALFPPRQHAQATPQASPQLGAPLSPFGQKSNGIDALSENFSKHENAWSVATRWLSISSQVDIPSAQIDAALDVLLGLNAHDGRLFQLSEWFVEEIRYYFRTSIESQLRTLWKEFEDHDRILELLNRTVGLLQTEQAAILRPLRSWLTVDVRRRGTRSANTKHLKAVEHLQKVAIQSFHVTVRRMIPRNKYVRAMAYASSELLHSMMDVQPPGVSQAVSLELLGSLSEIGLGGELGGSAFAHAVQEVIESYVDGFEMKVDWIHGQSRAPDLRDWVDKCLQPAVLECLRALSGDPHLELQASDCDKWQRHALNSLGRSRLENLLAYVQLWPRSVGAVLDLKDYIALADAKQHLAQTFIYQMEERIGHAGITTAELLGIYVAVIRVFKTLDNRSVLLEKVAQPLRHFLRDRQDTVKVIAASFLAEIDKIDHKDPISGTDADECCYEITREVVRSEHSAAQTTSSLDWDDMAWLPDPIDAGPDYRSTKSNDIISYMLALFDKETFIKEIQNILGERLLRTEDASLENEVRLVEMLKSRLGAEKLQSAEVMVRDMSDSARIMRLVQSAKSKVPRATEFYDAIPEDGISFNDLLEKMNISAPLNQVKARFIAVIKEAAVVGPEGRGHLLYRNPDFQRDPRDLDLDRFEAKILSSFFWPELRDDDFKVPAAIENAQKEYENGFKRIKNLRRLRWLSALGRATVELELKDRTVKVDAVKTWVATVIHAFQDDNTGAEDMDIDSEDIVTRKSVSELEEQLNMDEVLVRNAISFWVGQRVLYEVETDVYEVMETLPKEGEKKSVMAVPTQKEEAVSALKTQNAVLKDNKPMYEMFIVGMLTNGGAMDAARVAMMLKMVVPGGFNFGEEEVTWLLQGMESEGKVERRGDTWAIKK